jgi:hypothetical protein
MSLTRRQLLGLGTVVGVGLAFKLPWQAEAPAWTVVAPPSLPRGQWFHVGLKVTGPAPTLSCDLWIDGQKVESLPWPIDGRVLLPQVTA